MQLTNQQANQRLKPKSKKFDIPQGNAGVRVTLNLMSKLVKFYKSNIKIRTLAANLTKRLLQKDWQSEIKAIQKYVSYEIRYTKDIRGVETIQSPVFTLDNGYGDCDDKSTLVAALLESIGHPTRFVACGFNGGLLSHVYVETKIGNKWIGVETTEQVGLGWTPPNMTSKMLEHN